MARLNDLLLLVGAFAVLSLIIVINHEFSASNNHLIPAWVFQGSKDIPAVPPPDILPNQNNNNNQNNHNNDDESDFAIGETEKVGNLVCHGKKTESEVIFWKKVKHDRHYESPITPHHDMHHDKYLSFEYDNGGWNNVRMSLECLLVVAHAMGRTLVIPPQQHLYLLGKTHKDKHDKEAHDEMGFEDFFDLDLLKSHQGFHMISMSEFLTKEAAVGGLNPDIMRLPNNNTDLWGGELWSYLSKVADATPAWTGRFIAFPATAAEMALDDMRSAFNTSEKVQQRLATFGGERKPVYYDKHLQRSHHIHFRGDGQHRVLQHHYAFSFFADPNMQSFYKRFIRDYVRYKDNIQCDGHELVAAVRKDSLLLNPEGEGVYYAMHIRRGDFQFKDVKISAAEIVQNLDITTEDGKPLIPPGSLVYISTDDPDGVCKDCYVDRLSCNKHETPKPPGCPEDPSWTAMIKHGWKLRFLRDYQNQGYLKDVNPNTLGMIETIVCSRAKVFAGTYFSTFTGYIHRLRGYHGLGESTYYHHKNYRNHPQMKKSVGHGFSREWRAGWTDDAGDLI